MHSPPPIYDLIQHAPAMGLHLIAVAVLLSVSLVLVFAAALECASKLFDFVQFRIARKRRERAFRRGVRP